MSTPATAPSSNKRSTSATRNNKPPSRPSTPLRPSSRTSLRESQTFTPGASANAAFPLEVLEPAFAELADSMADLEANFMHMQLMHESLARFNESFAGFLYGLNMNAFCVDFPEQPIPDSFKRARHHRDSAMPHLPASSPAHQSISRPDYNDETFLTSDTSFVNNTPASRLPTKYANPAGTNQRPPSGIGNRGGSSAGRGARESGGMGKGGAAANRGGVAAGRGVRGSGIARGKPRGSVR